MALTDDERPIHKEVPIKVWVDVDEGIADFVILLNTILGVRTDACCQGTIGDAGEHPAPYRAYAMVHWTAEALAILESRFEVKPEGNGAWGYVYPLTCICDTEPGALCLQHGATYKGMQPEDILHKEH